MKTYKKFRTKMLNLSRNKNQNHQIVRRINPHLKWTICNRIKMDSPKAFQKDMRKKDIQTLWKQMKNNLKTMIIIDINNKIQEK